MGQRKCQCSSGRLKALSYRFGWGLLPNLPEGTDSSADPADIIIRSASPHLPHSSLSLPA